MSKVPPDSINISGAPETVTASVASTTVRVIRGGGAAIQLRYEDKETFAEILIQIRLLGGRATPEWAEYMRRNLIQEASRMPG